MVAGSPSFWVKKFLPQYANEIFVNINWIFSDQMFLQRRRRKRTFIVESQMDKLDSTKQRKASRWAFKWFWTTQWVTSRIATKWLTSVGRHGDEWLKFCHWHWFASYTLYNNFSHRCSGECLLGISEPHFETEWHLKLNSFPIILYPSFYKSYDLFSKNEVIYFSFPKYFQFFVLFC